MQKLLAASSDVGLGQKSDIKKIVGEESKREGEEEKKEGEKEGGGDNGGGAEEAEDE